MQVLRRTLFSGIAILSVLLVGLFIGCGDDDKGTNGDGGNGGDTGAFGDIGEMLTGAEDDFLTANAAIYASAEYFGPFIVAALGSGGLAADAQVTCLPAAALGQRFEFSGTVYAGVPDAAVSGNAARFWLYQMTVGGTPNTSQHIGHVDITCDQGENGVTGTINVVLGSVTVLSVVGNVSPGGLFTLIGTMRGQSGTPTMEIQGSQIPTLTGLTVAFSIPGSFSAAYSDFPDAEGGPYLNATAFGPYPNAEWSLFSLIEYNVSGNVTAGYASYNDASDAGIVTCIQSGTVANPVFSAPSTSCAPPENTVLSTTAAERQAMLDGYKALRSLYLTVAGFVELGFSIAGT